MRVMGRKRRAPRWELLRKEKKGVSCEFFDEFPAPQDDVPKGQIRVIAWIALQDIQNMFNKIAYNTHLLSGVLSFSSQVDPHRFLHSKWLVPPDRKSHGIQNWPMQALRASNSVSANRWGNTRNTLNHSPACLEDWDQLEQNVAF